MSDSLAYTSSKLSSEATNLVDPLNGGLALQLPSTSTDPFTTHRSDATYVMKLELQKQTDTETSKQHNSTSTLWLQDICTSHNYTRYFLFCLSLVLDLIRPTLTILTLN
jgi:hypothetical protein